MPVLKRYYTVKEKLNILSAARTLRENGAPSMRNIAAQLGIASSQLHRWQQQADKLQEFHDSKRRNAKALHTGFPSQLADIEEEILRFIFESQEEGMAVSIRMVTLKAAELDANFQRKSSCAKDTAVRRFVNSHGLVHCLHTHQSQQSTAQMAEAALEFMREIRPSVVGQNRHEDFILNMDQTLIFFSMLPKTTLNVAGARSINVRTSTNSTMRVTVAVCVTASGKMLPPLIICKGRPNGRIEREFNHYNERGVYAVQQKAWMDETVMKLWVERVLKPYLELAPAGIEPLLLLDSYRCHFMASVLDPVREIGADVKHIPGGCTGLCQPIDVGIAKPLKGRVRLMGRLDDGPRDPHCQIPATVTRDACKLDCDSSSLP